MTDEKQETSWLGSFFGGSSTNTPTDNATGSNSVKKSNNAGNQIPRSDDGPLQRTRTVKQPVHVVNPNDKKVFEPSATQAKVEDRTISNASENNPVDNATYAVKNTFFEVRDANKDKEKENLARTHSDPTGGRSNAIKKQMLGEGMPVINEESRPVHSTTTKSQGSKSASAQQVKTDFTQLKVEASIARTSSGNMTRTESKGKGGNMSRTHSTRSSGKRQDRTISERTASNWDYHNQVPPQNPNYMQPPPPQQQQQQQPPPPQFGAGAPNSNYPSPGSDQAVMPPPMYGYGAPMPPYGYPQMPYQMPYGMPYPQMGWANGYQQPNLPLPANPRGGTKGQQRDRDKRLKSTGSKPVTVPVTEAYPLANEWTNCFHSDAVNCGDITENGSKFTKTKYHGRLSMISEGVVHQNTTFNACIRFTEGDVSIADGIGFVFGTSLPCTKNIQAINSIFFNKRGQIAIRRKSEVHRLDRDQLAPLQVNRPVVVHVDLINRFVTFAVPDSNGTTRTSTTVYFDDFWPDITPSGYICCVIKNQGVACEFASIPGQQPPFATPAVQDRQNGQAQATNGTNATNES